jgi:hypothetical protein
VSVSVVSVYIIWTRGAELDRGSFDVVIARAGISRWHGTV